MPIWRLTLGCKQGITLVPYTVAMVEAVLPFNVSLFMCSEKSLGSQTVKSPVQ